MQMMQARIVLVLLYGLSTIQTADITLLVNRNKPSFNLTCVATGTETLAYGMTWMYKTIDQISNESHVSKYINQTEIEKFDESINLTDDFKQHTKSSLYYNLPAVFDHRWEDTNDPIKFEEEVYVIHLSVLLFSNVPWVTIKLNTEYESYKVYVNQSTTEIEFSTNNDSIGPLPEKADNTSNKSFGKWHHYTIYATDNAAYKLKKLTKDWNGYQNSKIPFSISRLEVTGPNLIKVFWKLHDYKFLNIPTTNATIDLFNHGIRIHKKQTACIAFYLFTAKSCKVKVQLRLNSTGEILVSQEYSTSEKWAEIKIIHDFLDISTYYIKLSITKPNECFAALDDIRHCERNEVRILEQQHLNATVGCTSFLDQEAVVYYKVPSNTSKPIENLHNIGGANNISCEYLKQDKYCNKNVICNEGECRCAAEYTGKYCQNFPEITLRVNTSATSALCSIYGAFKTETYCTVHHPDNKEMVNVINNTLKLYGLNPTTKYKISCKSCISTDCRTIDDSFTTDVCIDISENNVQYNSTSNSINFNITGQNDAHCPSNQYVIHLNDDKIFEQKLMNFTQISNLKQFTDYKIKIIRKGNSSPVFVVNVKTDYLEPGTVADLKQINGSCFEVSPPIPPINITGYLFAFKAHSNNCDLNTSHMNNITMETNTTVICIDLMPYFNYNIEVKAINSKGTSKKGRSLLILTEPQGDITNDEKYLDIKIKESKIEILLPKCNNTRGPLFYKVLSTCLEEWCNGRNTSSDNINYLNKTLFETFIKSLTPFSRHNISVTISRSNISTDGNHNLNLSIKTPPSQPNNISEVKIYSLEDGKVFIKWKPAYPPTGEVELYHIYSWRNGDTHSFNTTKYGTCALWDGYICAELNCLKGLTYNITVLQKNKYVDRRSIYSTEIKIDEMDPESPKNFTAENTTNCDILLKWLYPDNPNGHIRYFNVTLVEAKSKKPLSFKISDGLKKVYEHKLTNLTASTYNIYIQAHNQYEGKKSEIRTVTVCSKYSEAPKSAASEWIINLCITILVIIIICVIIIIFLKFRKRKFLDTQAEEILLISSSTAVKKIDLRALLSNYLDESGENIFEIEFQDVDDPDHLSQTVGTISENRHKNRFRNVIPLIRVGSEITCSRDNDSKSEQKELLVAVIYNIFMLKSPKYKRLIQVDHTRVILGDIADTDYINANYIHGYRGYNTYIATQCPKAETVHDFWRMVWQENVKIIVCLASVSESQKKVYQYWPNDYIHIQFDEFIIYHKSNYTQTDFIVRRLEVCRGNESRSVLQLNYISWPDQSIPLFPISFLQYIKYVQGLQNINTGPIVVHCSAGIGRTGTYIMCDNLINLDDDEIDVVDYLREIRTCRPLLVSRVSQYMLIYFILDEHYNGKNMAIERRDILEMPQIDVDEMLIKHYNYIFDRQYAHEMLHFDSVKMVSEMSMIFVDGYQGERKFVCVELQPKNFSNIWWMIEQNAIKTVFILQETQGVNMFWPNDIAEKKVESFTITCDKFTDLNQILIYDLKYTKSGYTGSVQVIYYKNWKSNVSQPNNVTSFSNLYAYYKNINFEDNETIMLCCHNGTTASGLFIALDLVMKKLENDHVFDICWAVLGIRPQHRFFMDELDQYKFIYKMVKYFIHQRNSSGNEAIYENIQN